MKEGAPVGVIKPIEERALDDRLAQFPRALDHINIGNNLVAEFGPKGVTLNKDHGDGETEKVLFDAQILKAMKGGAFGMYNELVEGGFKAEADAILEAKKPIDN